MTPRPARPKIYHITHIDNLAAIAREGFLLNDREMVGRGGPTKTIGMSAIKRRRIEELEVACHPGTFVGDYVPFYFCPRSVMLYVISRSNHPELAYTGGQDPILHLEADLLAVEAWARRKHVRWAFSLSNAGARYAEFRTGLDQLDQLDWPAIGDTDFRAPKVKEAKQAECLVHERFPFELVEQIGVRSAALQVQAKAILAKAPHRPPVSVLPDWYF